MLAVNQAAQDASAAMQMAQQAISTANAAKTEADTAKSTADAAAQAAAQRVRGFDLGTVRITETATLALALGVSSKVFDVAGAVAGEPILMTPATILPAGWMLGQAVCAVAGKVTITYYRPALALGASVAFDVPLIALRK